MPKIIAERGPQRPKCAFSPRIPRATPRPDTADRPIAWPRQAARALIAVLGFLALVPGFAVERETITWAVIDRPPIYILTHTPAGMTLGDGVGDQLLRLYWAALPEYNHRADEMNTARIWKSLQTGSGTLCSVGAIRTPERDRFIYYTGGVLGYPLRIATTEPEAPLISQGRPTASFAALIQDRRFHGLRARDRKYGGEIDRIIEAAGPDSPLEAVTLHDSGPSFLRLVALGRADYTIEFDITIRYLATKGELPQPLVTIPIEEGSELNRAGIACSRTPAGRDVIAKLDRYIRQNITSPPYRHAIEGWLSDGELRDLREQIDAYYRFRSSRSDINF